MNSQSQDASNEANGRRVGKLLARLPSWVAGVALFLLMAMTFSDVILRSLINDPIESATELTRILMAIVVFSSLPVVAARGGHIVVDLLDGFFTPFASRIRDGLVNIVCGGLLLWPVQRVYVLAARAHGRGDVTEYLNLPQFYMSSFITVLALATAIIMIIRGVLILLGYRVATLTENG
ncbi:MAG: TRAP transporter small permease [Fimbriimonadaceae bacterium]|nr:TRAP transporter small permease [Alphaproteobacteria bacterium]